MNNMVLDAVNPLERVRLSSQLAASVGSLKAVTSPLERVRATSQVADLIRKLGGGQQTANPQTTNPALAFPLTEASSSYSGISHSGNSRAKSDAEAYEKAISDAVADASPFVETESQRVAMATEESAYRTDYLAQYRQLMNVRAGTYSGHIAGRSGLNTKQADSRNSALDKAMARFYGWTEAQGSRIKDAVLRARSPEQLAVAQAAKDAELSAKDEQRAKVTQKNIDFMVKLLTFKAGDDLKLGSSIIKKVSKDREGNPSKLTYVMVDGSTPFDDKIDLVSVLYKGDKEALRRDAEAARALISGPTPEPAHPDNGRAPVGGMNGMNGEFYKGGTFLPNTTMPKQGAAPGGKGTSGRGFLIEPGVFGHPPEPGAKAILNSYQQFIAVDNGVASVTERPDVAIASFVNDDVTEGRAFLRAAVEAYNNGMRWFVPGDIEVTDTHRETPALEIVEHVTKGGKGKTIRGIVRTELTYAEAKAIDEYTFKKDGGWFIREKHLAGYVAPEGVERPAPTPKVELTPEQQAQAEADRLADEQLREQKRRQEVGQKLRAAGASVVEKAEEELGRDRNTNTARRASMASSITERHEAARATGLTMQNLAAAIESGEAQHLAGITSRAAVESLQESLRAAMYEAERGMGSSYSEQMARKGRGPEASDIQYAKFPMPMWGSAGTSLSKVLDAIKGKKGSVELAKKMRFSPGPDAEMIRELKAMIGDKETSYQVGWWNLEQVAKVARLQRAGISNTEGLKAALTEYLQFRAGARAEDPIKKAERAIIGQKVGIDFFPTPMATASRMADLAGISKGDRVLEPSAGNGNLADAAKAAGGTVDVIEISSQLRDILTAKGYNVVAFDFDSFEPEEKYDAILMNPPFSNRQDAAHIQRAFGMLKAGGRLAAIAGEGVFFGSDAKAVQFRDWLDSHGADVEKLGQGTFNDKTLLAQTGANARLIVIQK